MLWVMELHVRRGIALTFALLFLVIAPLTIAYGRGYRVDMKHRRVSLTGVISLAGFPKRIHLSLDSQNIRTTSLPVTARGVLPGDHTVLVGAPGYGTQVLGADVRPGETVFLDDIQLIRENPTTTLRTGIPPSARLAPTGNALAWINQDQVVIAAPTGTQHAATVASAQKLLWSDDGQVLEVRTNDDERLAYLNRTGVRLSAPVEMAGVTKSIRDRVGEDVQFTSVQHIPDGSGWFLTSTDTAWLLPNGTDEPELFSRWYEPIVQVIHLGRQVTATIRNTDITIRNAANGQVTTLVEANVTAVAVTDTPGTFQALVRDGDLRRWVEVQLF